MLSNIRVELDDEGIEPSDRRFKQSLGVLQARAFIHEREVVQVEDVVILEHVLWETIDQKETVSAIIRNYAHDGITQKLFAIQKEANHLMTKEVLLHLTYDKSACITFNVVQALFGLLSILVFD